MLRYVIGFLRDAAEVGILIYLIAIQCHLWLSGLGGDLLFLPVVVVLLLVAHWVSLENFKLPKGVRIRLACLTGPWFLVCVCLILTINLELKRCAIAGGASKELVPLINAMTPDKDGYPQATQCVLQQLRDRRSLAIALLICAALLYESRLPQNSANERPH